MATPQSSFIIKHYDGFGGNFVDSQYLGASYDAGKPHIFQNTLMKIYSSQSRFITGKPLTALAGAGSTIELDDEIYRWRLQGAETKSARIVENIESANTTPGINQTTFRIKLDLDYFANPDVLMPEDNNFPLEIIDGPIQDGSGYVYTVRLQGDSPAAFMPAYMMEVGREFSKVWTSVASEYNTRYGTQQSPDIFMLESQVGAFAQKVTVTDKAWRMDGRLGFEFMYTDMHGNTKTTKKFLPMAESKMYDELAKSIEHQLTYGKRQTHASPDNEYWIKSGPGLREQMKDGWTEYYNGPVTVNLLKDYIMDIFFARTDETDRKVVMMTGTLGSMLFHEALASVAQSFLTVDTHYIQSMKSPVDTPALQFGAQFRRYNGPEGVVIDLVKNPLYDSRVLCKRMHPQYPDKPIDSARFTVMDFGMSAGQSNISMVKLKDYDSWGYSPGIISPTGMVKGGMAGSLVPGYDIYTRSTAGIWIKDVTRTGELIFDYEL